MSDFLSDNDPRNLAKKVRELEQRLAALEQRPVEADTLDQFTNDLGTIRQGELLSAESGQPDDGNYTGLFWSHQGYIFTINGSPYLLNLGGMNLGNIQFGLSATNGAGIFAGGDGIINSDGINLNGVRYALRHYATDINGANPRFGRFEMLYENGKSIPSLALTYMDGATSTNIVSNGGFESGDLTGWTPTHAGYWSILTTDVYSGTYQATCTQTVGANASVWEYLDSGRFAITASSLYKIEFASKGFINAFSDVSEAVMSVIWYDDPTAGNILRADLLWGSANNAWLFKSSNLTSPIGAASVKVEIWLYFNNFNCLSPLSISLEIDAISISGITFQRKILFGPEPEIDNGLTTTKIVGATKYLWTPPAPIAAPQATASGNCTNGVHYVKVCYVDIEGSTMPSPASGSVTVDASHNKISVNITQGPWGTSARQIYMTMAGGTQYYLALTIADNHYPAGAYTVDIADASLGAAAPQFDTSGSRPLFPRSDMVFCYQFNLRKSGTLVALPINNSANQVRFGFFINLSTANADDGDRYECGMYLEEGTYIFSFYGVTNNNAGKIDLYIDGVSVSSGHDLYTAAAGYDYTFDTGETISVIGSGYHLIEWVVNGKNASSSDYRVLMTYTSAQKSKY